MTPQRFILWSQLRIGLAATAFIVVGAIAIFFIDEVRALAADRYVLYFHTFTTQSLRPRAPVWLAGQPVGYVEKLEFRSPEYGIADRLRVELNLRPSAQPFVVQGSRAQVITSGRLGEALVNILPASESAPPIPDGGELPTAPELDVSELTDKLRSSADSVTPVARRWLEVARTAREGPGTLTHLLREPSELTGFRRALHEAAALFDTLALAGTGLAETLGDPEVRAALHRIAERLPRIRERWRGDGGSLGAFAADTAMALHLERLTGQVERLEDRLERGRGSLGRLLNDRALAVELRETRAALQRLRADLTAPGRRERGSTIR